jgi:hypothetical protein
MFQEENRVIVMENGVIVPNRIKLTLIYTRTGSISTILGTRRAQFR